MWKLLTTKSPLRNEIFKNKPHKNLRAWDEGCYNLITTGNFVSSI